jgi:glycyl-tRNA synthetase beta chain
MASDLKNFTPIVESANRISRIVKEDVTAQVNKALLTYEAEKTLYENVLRIKDFSYESLYTSLVEINPSIEKFFEDVLVMDKDDKIKQNRLAMLTILKKNYEKITDFSALQI